MAFNNNLLFYFIRDAIAPYSEDFAITDRLNPVQIRLNGKGYSARISYIHDSGNTRDNDDEVRIQLSRTTIDTQKNRQRNGLDVAFIGFFPGGDTFVAWDPRHVFSLNARKQVNLYTRQTQQNLVSTRNAAVYRFKSEGLEEESFAIALPTPALGLYLENIETFHALRNESSIISLVKEGKKAVAEAGLGFTGDVEVEDAGERKRITYERIAYPRDPKFKKQVLKAYGQTCCICGRQLGIVQAAHIIPHAAATSPNSVTNGLALCIEHHRLYDDALLLPGPERRLVFNEKRAEYLSYINQGEGLEGIRELHDHPYKVPDDPKEQPWDDYLREGLRWRLGE